MLRYLLTDATLLKWLNITYNQKASHGKHLELVLMLLYFTQTGYVKSMLFHMDTVCVFWYRLLHSLKTLTSIYLSVCPSVYFLMIISVLIKHTFYL